MAGVATEKPDPHLYPLKECAVLLARNQTLFICSLELGVDTEKPRFQKAALNTPG